MPKIVIDKATKLDGMISAGVDLLRELREVESGKKLTGPSFAEAARVEAEISASRLRRLRAKLDRKQGVDACKAFLKRCAREFATSNFPCPPGISKCDRVIRVYAREAANAEMAALGITPMEMIALAAAQSAEQYPAAFGTVTDWPAHMMQQQNTRAALQVLCEAMAQSWGAKDIVVERVSDTARADGLQRVVLARAPHLTIDSPDWPLRLLEHVLFLQDANPEKKKGKGKKSKKRRASDVAASATALPKAERKRDETLVPLTQVSREYLR